MLKLYALILILLLSLSACATIEFGHDFDPRKFESWVERGVTTQQQVENFIGTPVATGSVVEHDGTHYSRWLYYYGKGKIHKLQNANFKTLEIRFNTHKQVVSYNWSAE